MDGHCFAYDVVAEHRDLAGVGQEKRREILTRVDLPEPFAPMMP